MFALQLFGCFDLIVHLNKFVVTIEVEYFRYPNIKRLTQLIYLDLLKLVLLKWNHELFIFKSCMLQILKD